MMKLCNNFDLFGTQIFLRFRGNQQYKTTLGLSLSFIIVVIITIRMSIIIIDAYKRLNPIVLYKERQVDSPSVFTMDSSNVTFAFGMQDPTTFNQFVDTQIYNITMKQFTRLKVFNSTTKNKDIVWKIREVKISRCQLDNFQNQDTREYFLNLNYTNLYCIDPKEKVEIEGDFNADQFSFFTIKVMKCQGNNCATPSDISKKLLKGFFSIYYTDIIIDPEQKDNPFKYYARDIYWMTSTGLPRDTTMNFRNTYVESDFGWFQEDIKSEYHGQYSSTENQLIILFDKVQFF